MCDTIYFRARNRLASILDEDRAHAHLVTPTLVFALGENLACQTWELLTSADYGGSTVPVVDGCLVDDFAVRCHCHKKTTETTSSILL